MRSTIELLRKYINEADAIVIGAGAGLSSAAGLEYGGETFLKNFKWMHDQYGYNDMYSAGFHHFNTSEEKWAYWAKFIYLVRYKDGAKRLYKKLFDVVKNKNYFVITTNVDHQFQLVGFDKERLFYTQGDYGLFQCSTPCHNKTYDNKEQILGMLQSIRGNKIATDLIPRCPVCGREMSVNLRCDDTFVEDKGWQKAKERYLNFLEENRNKKILFLELGVGMNTPIIIKIPFIKMTYNFKNAFYIPINLDKSYVPIEIKNKSFAIADDLSKVIKSL